MVYRDIGSYIEPVVSISQVDYDGSSEINGTEVDRVPDGDQKYWSALALFTVDNGAADEAIEAVVEHSDTTTDGDFEELKDLGVIDYIQADGTTLAAFRVDLETAKKYIRLRVKSEGQGDTDVGNADLTVIGHLILGGADRVPTDTPA
jgi:hypothetical protein